MVGVDKKKLTDLFKKKTTTTTTSTTKPTGTVTGTTGTVKKTASTASTLEEFKKKHGDSDATKSTLEDFKAKHGKSALELQKEILHSKTHQDLINAAYKAAETLKIAPWVLLRAAGWGHFTDDRGKRYDGPAIDEIEGLDDAQKKALKTVLEIK